MNIVAVISPMDLPDAALLGHVFWGSLLLAVLQWGPGAIALDRCMLPALRRWVFGERAASVAAQWISRVA